jgi:hypothetical protein
MICCFFSSFKTFAMLREATYPPAAVNVLDVSSESMAAFQVFLYGRFWVFTEDFNVRNHHQFVESSATYIATRSKPDCASIPGTGDGAASTITPRAVKDA